MVILSILDLMFKLSTTILSNLFNACHIDSTTDHELEWIEHCGIHSVWRYAHPTHPLIIKRYHPGWLAAFPWHAQNLIAAETITYADPTLPVIRPYSPSPLMLDGALWALYPFHQSESPPQQYWLDIQNLRAVLKAPLSSCTKVVPPPKLTSDQKRLLEPLQQAQAALKHSPHPAFTHTAHRDLRPSNVIWIRQKPYAIDLEHSGPRAELTDQLALAIDWNQPWPQVQSTEQMKHACAALLDEWSLWLEQLLYLSPQNPDIEARFHHQKTLTFQALKNMALHDRFN
ncbi:MAG: hypothetical protein CMF51_00480 [Legionellales bacterium]|nr:hypothetical protein [Legionellales bacterium]